MGVQVPPPAPVDIELPPDEFLDRYDQHDLLPWLAPLKERMQMEVTETLNEGLKRELKVVVTAAQLEQQMMARLTELGATANIRGFRKGKVPIPHLRKLYGKSVMAEVVQKTIEETSQQAIAEKEVKPAYQPEIGMTEDEEEIGSIIDGNSDLSYTMNFEVVPPIEIQEFGKLDVIRHTVEVADEHIDVA
ncbi:MAG: trigger factor, partial [Aestuariivirgaceae bacterium]